MHIGVCQASQTVRSWFLIHSTRLSGPANAIVTKTVHQTKVGGGGGQVCRWGGVGGRG